MPNYVHYTRQPVMPVATGQTHGYVGLSAVADPGPLLPFQGGAVWDLSGAGAPVDGTSGTGAGQVDKGGRYTDVTNGNLYLNGGTLASPTWKLVTRAA